MIFRLISTLGLSLCLDHVTSSSATNNGLPGYEIMGEAERKISLFMRLCLYMCVFARRAECEKITSADFPRAEKAAVGLQVV